MRSGQLKEHFRNLLYRGNLSHAYILVAGDADRLYWLAKEVAGQITPYKEDIHTVCADDLSVKDKSIEELIERLNLKPLVGERNIALIRDAETMTARAQNRLLKTLEEPPGKSVIFLLTNKEENLLATVRSRCVLFRMDNWGGATNGESYEDTVHAVASALLRGKDYYIIIGALEEVMKDRGLAHAFLDGLENWYRDVLFYGIGRPSGGTIPDIGVLNSLMTLELAEKTIAFIEVARRDLYHHINVGYAIKNMVLKIINEEESI